MFIPKIGVSWSNLTSIFGWFNQQLDMLFSDCHHVKQKDVWFLSSGKSPARKPQMLRSIEAKEKEGQDEKIVANMERIWLVNVGGLSPLQKMPDPWKWMLRNLEVKFPF